MRPLFAALLPAALIALPYDAYPNTNAAYALDLGPKSPGPSTSTAFYKALGGAASLAACAAAAASWVNASAPGARCLTAVWLRAPSNATFEGTCWCMPQPKWIPVADGGADSARLRVPCASDFDCSYNGACGAGGACVCDVGWRGLRCGELALGAVDAAAPGLREANASTGANVSTWGAPMLLDGATGTWHAWASEMVNGCGLNTWRSNSQVVHFEAGDPSGPWARREVTQPVFAHEPDVVRGPAGEWVMVWSAWPLPDAADRCANCSAGATAPGGPRGGCGPHYMHGFKQMMAVAPGPNGPWDAFEVPQLSAGWDWNFALAIRADGSAEGLIRAGMAWRAPPGGWRNASAWAPVGGAPEGPQLPDNSNVEDPALWIDAKGRLHALFHSMEPSTRDVAYCGVHAFSEAGGAWTSGGWAFGATVNFTDGTSFTFSRRERPHLLFNGDGTPRALSSGAQYGGPPTSQGDGIFTLVQPVLRA